MIRIYFDRISELRAWYAGQMIPLIHARQLQPSLQVQADTLSLEFARHLCALSEDMIRDILLTPPEKLCAQYDWAREYVMLCDAVALYPSFKEGHPWRKAGGAREAYLKEYEDCAFFRQALQEAGLSYKEAAKSWEKMTKVIRRVEWRRGLLDSVITQKFEYSILSGEIRGDLVKKMGVPVCPYCNRQYIQSVLVEGKNRYLGDLDHILPKSSYQLFSLSLWNLTPSCKPCNQMFKKNRGARVLNPQEQGFGDDCILVLDYHNVREITGREPPAGLRWEIQPFVGTDVRELMENNLKVFQLDEVYRFHLRDIQMALQRRYLTESQGYKKSVNRVLPIPDDPSLWYGVSLDPAKFQEELLSKAIYDVITYN